MIPHEQDPAVSPAYCVSMPSMAPRDERERVSEGGCERLAGLLKRIVPEAKATTLGTAEEVERFLAG